MKGETLSLFESGRAVKLHEEMESRFLSYALSTIVSRALPDVRDGLKPVHRRILYAMYRMRLTPDAKFRKCAAIVGEVLGKYHPHGDQAAYDALVRLAQDFSLRYPLILGQGNFGNIDGDPPAAMRYTEAKLSEISGDLLADLPNQTVDFHPNYDGTAEEPGILPAAIPNILVNGGSGIAVGIATNIPPHNLKEVVDGLVTLLENPEATDREILKYIKGPDFPTAGLIVTPRREIAAVYQEGRGPIKIRGEYEVENLPRGRWQIVITSIPYTVNKSRLIEKIAELIVERKIPYITDIRDESTDEIRVVLEPKSPDVDVEKTMAFLYRNTDLEFNFQTNLTALVPGGVPMRQPLIQMMRHFLDFRVVVVKRRLEHELKVILERLHLLEGFEKTYDRLEEVLKIIRRSESRDQAKERLMKLLEIDAEQASAVLDLRLASLVGLEIQKIREERAEKEARRKEIERTLKSDDRIRKLIRGELESIKEKYGDPRRTKIAAKTDEPEYRQEDFIEHEETNVVVSRNGWVRRLRTVSNEGSLRFKEDDSLLVRIQLNTRHRVVFFTSLGKVYVIQAHDLPVHSGFGDPIQNFFRFGDGERVISVAGLPADAEEPEEGKKTGPSVPPEFLQVTEGGMGFRFSLDSADETTRSGRRLVNLKEDDAVFSVVEVRKPLLFILSSSGRGILFAVEEIAKLSGAGAGVRLIRLDEGETVTGIKNVSPEDGLTVMFKVGKEETIPVKTIPVQSRGGVGRRMGSPRKTVSGIC